MKSKQLIILELFVECLVFTIKMNKETVPLCTKIAKYS